MTDASPPPAAEPHPQILEYERFESAATSDRKIVILGVLPWVPAVIAIFTGFHDRSPLHEVLETGRDLILDRAVQWWHLSFLLMLPFILAIPILAARLSLVLRLGLTHAWSVIAWVFAGIGATCVVGFPIAGFSGWPSHLFASVPMGSGPLTLLIGAALLLAASRAGIDRSRLAVTAMGIAWVANAITCLIAYARYPMIGWWLTLASVLLFAFEVMWMTALIVRNAFDRRLYREVVDPKVQWREA